jgi:multiple sugar transport system ATP-binding protein
MADLAIRRVSKQFEKHRAVDDVSVAVTSGEFLVLLGPSGCGKSTLLRMIAGLEMPTLGEIHIGPRDVTRLEPRERNVAMVFQNYALYPHLSIFENIAFPLRSRGNAPAAEIDRKVRWAAGLVGIEKLLDRRPRETSGGERQRTALARALVREPDVFLLDEPLSNLDAKLRNTAREEIRTFQQRVGVTAVYVTHDQVEAMGLGDRIAVMEGGRLRQLGTPEEVYRRPADTFVATFIGTPPMNLMEAEPGTLLGVRPEALHDAATLRGDAEVTLDLRVRRVEYLGGEWLVYAVVEGRRDAPRITVRLAAANPPPTAPGALWQVAALAGDVTRFSGATGLRLPG